MPQPNPQSGSICLLPRLDSIGGPTSFYHRFRAALQARGIASHNDPFAKDCAAIMVIGGTRHLDRLWQARRRGVRIVQRLDGMNWIHRKRRTGLRHFLRAEANNWILQIIRRWLADAVIYQSQYVRSHWLQVFGETPAKSHQIYNGVNLNIFTPHGDHQRPQEHIRMLVVEGRLKGGHEVGLENAVRLAELLGQQIAPKKVELMVAADVDSSLKAYWQTASPQWITWCGVVPRERIPEIDRSAHLFFSAEVNAPCPNSVIEALACGLPVISFETGSLPELVQGDAGRLVPYGTNYASLGAPDLPALASAAVEVLDHNEHFRHAARQHAETMFNIEDVVDRYLKVLLNP